MEPNLANSERVLRHIPGGTMWQAPPDQRISSVNFRLRPDESGISVTRDHITSADELLARLGTPAAGSRIAVASVEAIRQLGLEVVSAPIGTDAGHAEIRSGKSSLESKSIQKALARLFAYVE